jgi:tRNA pseudouridine65 synthase
LLAVPTPLPPVRILAQFERYLALSKPSGVAVHRTRGSAGLPLLQRVRDQIGQLVYPVHRLDRGTSGAILMARDPAAQRELSRCFEQGLVRKQYLAVVRGWPPETLCVDHPLRRLDDDAVALAAAERQAASTQIDRLSVVETPHPTDHWPTSRYALVRVVPREGRRHQVRRHLKHISHPIIGDTSYGKGLHNRVFREHYGCDRLLLHAECIDYIDPFDGQPRRIAAEWPEDFRRPLVACGLWPNETVTP